ncbi:hypothetical protein EV715DRAFT_297971 [Schizophyllum commune]
MSRPTAQEARRHRRAQSRPPRRRPPEDASDKPDIAFDTSPNDGLVGLLGGRDSGGRFPTRPHAPKSRILTRNAPRSAREFLVEGHDTGRGGRGREAARSAAGDADDAQGIFWRFFKS